jgi:hypothetical protein
MFEQIGETMSHDFRLMYQPRVSRVPAWLRSLWLWF